MEDYLRGVKSTLGAAVSERIHAVLGGPEADVDTVASTLCLALHLSQKEPTGPPCLPVLCVPRRHPALPEETARYLRRLRVSESSLLWREDVDLQRLHDAGQLSITLLGEGLLEIPECDAIAASVLRVVHRHGQLGAGEEGALSAAETVAKEILQEAAARVGAVLGECLGEALRLQRESLWTKHGRQSAELEEIIKLLEESHDIPAAVLPKGVKIQDMENLMTRKLKEFSDGEMTLALTIMAVEVEDWYCHGGELKSFCHRHSYDSLVVVTVHPARQQVVIYSDNTDVLNQICCELAESSRWPLSDWLKADDCCQGRLQVYSLPVTAFPYSAGVPPLEEWIHSLLKELVDRRSLVLACHPSSRTSSTEGVAGSVEFSQGSSGINDMYGSDTERADGTGGERATADGEEDSGVAGVAAGRDLMSPDSGMATIRSSRSSKESSVFLSDDSPIGDLTAGGAATSSLGGLFLRNPSPLGFPSLSPPVPPERRRHRSGRNKSDTCDLFSFDPFHSSNVTPAGGGGAGGGGGGGASGHLAGGGGTGGSALSAFEDLSLVDFSAAPGQQVHRADARHTAGTAVPRTPANSLADGCPPYGSEVSVSSKDVAERMDALRLKDSVSSSLSEAWDEFGFDTQGESTSDESTAGMPNKDDKAECQDLIAQRIGIKGSYCEERERDSGTEVVELQRTHIVDMRLKPQLSLITEHTETYDSWNADSEFGQAWNSVTLPDLQMTPPDEEIHGKYRSSVTAITAAMSFVSRKREPLSTLTPETSKEEDEGSQGRKGDRQKELLDFWTYSAQKGFLKSDSGTTASYPESLDMWNMTIRDDSLSPLTTPDADNLSERSESLHGQLTKAGEGPLLESPVGFSDSGMEMWNTTILEDSPSTVTSPVGPGKGVNADHIRSVDASSDPAEQYLGQQKEGGQEDQGSACTGFEQDVKIVIEGAEEGIGTEETRNGDIQIIRNNSTSDFDNWAMPVPSMVTSTSEYDNVGAGGWSIPPSPEAQASPDVDTIQLEAESSPFISVVKPVETGGQDQYQKPDSHNDGNDRAASQVFLFEETFESGHMTKNGSSAIENEYGSYDVLQEHDWTEQLNQHLSPFIMVSSSSQDQSTLVSNQLRSEETSVTQTQAQQSIYRNISNWDNLLTSAKIQGHPCSESTYDNVSSSDDWTTKITTSEDAPSIENNWAPQNGAIGNVDGAITDMSQVSSSEGERDTLKYSPDSRDDPRSNSDSSSGLEMEYIIVSGSVKESEKDCKDRFRGSDGGRPVGKRNGAAETFSMLSVAATLLQAQPLQKDHPECTEQSQQKQVSAVADSLIHSNVGDKALSLQTASAYPSQSNTATRDSNQSTYNKHATHQIYYLPSNDQSNTDACSSSERIIGIRLEQTSAVNTSPDHKMDSESRTQAQVEEPGCDDQSQSIVVRSVSASLRYPSDHFLKTREEVYVRSQISMEDSDEGEGQSPITLAPCHPSLGGLQGWGGQGQASGCDIPLSTSERQSPVLTNSSVSHNSSLTGTPLSETGLTRERIVGSPFSGDLMEEGNEDGQGGDKTVSQLRASSGWISELYREKDGSPDAHRPQSEHTDLLMGTEEMSNQCSRQFYDKRELNSIRDTFPQSTVDLTNRQAITAHGFCDKWLAEQVGGQIVSQESPSSSRGPEEVCLQPFGGSGGQTPSDVQTQYGYNYHQTDQRTESQQNTDDVYAEFRTEGGTVGCQRDGGTRAHECSSVHQGEEYKSEVDDDEDGGNYMTKGQYDKDSYASELRLSGDPDVIHDRRDEGSSRRASIQQKSEDHAQYVPEGYTHFLLTGPSPQADDEAMMTMVACSEEAEPDDRDVPSSSLELSGGSNQRRRLPAPPMNVSLERSEGSEDLDTGDELRVSLDELDEPDEADSQHEPANQAPAAAMSDAIPECSLVEERCHSKLWRSVVIGDQQHRIDMKSIEAYQRVISHGGYYDGHNAIIVFAACFLPDSNCDNYHYVMENLFLYVISTLELMVAEDYMIVYLNGATPRRRMPGFSWMKKCYQMIDRRLKKNLKLFIIVHPSWFIRAVLGLARPFISSKFNSKIKYVHSLAELQGMIPMEYIHIPPSIIKLDEELQETTLKADKKGSPDI